jgi:chromosome segregation ATPase
LETIDLIILAALAGLAALVIWKMRGGEASEHRDRAEGLEREKTELQARHDEAVQLRVQMETRLESAQATIDELKREAQDLQQARNEAVAARHEAERASDVASQQLNDVEKRIADWETARNQSIEAAKAAAMASSRELSAQLMAEHKRES